MSSESEGEGLDVTCPCCRARLVVDAETGAVLGSTPNQESPRDFDSLMGDVLEGESRRDQLFRKAFRAEQKRSDVLARKFDRARQAASGDEERDESG
jgi:hypothetical protein